MFVAVKRDPARKPHLRQLFVKDNGMTLQARFSEAVTHSQVPSVTATGGNPTATYSSGSGTAVLNYTLSRSLASTEETTADFSQGAVTLTATGVALPAVSARDCIHKLQVAHGTAPGGGTQHETMPSPLRNGYITAAQTGNYSAASTWTGGVVPRATDRVRIPTGITVTVDTTNLQAKAIFVEGVLKASRSASHSLKFTTIVVPSGGELNLGDNSSTIPSSVTSTWTVRNEALEYRYHDPFQFSNGIIILSGGKFYAHGAVKTEYLRLAAEASATDTALEVESEPSGWEAGDEVVLMSTAAIASKTEVYSPSGKSAGRDPEVRIIDSVVGTTVNVTVGLTDDHPPALDESDADPWHPHLVNLTRNVKIRSEAEFDAGVTTVGHILITGSADAQIRYVETTDLGRSRGGIASGNSGIDDTIYDEETGVLTHYGENPRGRYPFHFHHCRGPATDPDVTTLTFGGSPTGGTFRLVYMDDDGVPSETGDISWDATGATLASNIQAALDTLHGASAVTVTGTGPFTLTSAGTVRQPMGVINDLTGTDPTIDCGYQFQLQGCTIRRGGRWAVAVHSSSFGLIKDNVVYDATAAGFSLEDGNEWANVIDGNFASFIHNEGASEPFGPCITANGFWFQNEFQVWENNIVACCWQNTTSVQDINGLTEPYRAHARHNDRLGRDSGGAVHGAMKRPLYRGADTIHGTVGVDYVENDPFSRSQIVARGDEHYALFAGLSYDHLSDTRSNAHHKTTGMKSWHTFNGGIFIYGNGDTLIGTIGSVHTHENFEFRGFVQQASNINAHAGVRVFRNGKMVRASNAPTSPSTPVGFQLQGGTPARTILLGENLTIHCDKPFSFGFGGNNGYNDGPPDSFMPGTLVVLRDCTATQPVGAIPALFNLQSTVVEGAVQCPAPMVIHQWWLDNFNADGRLVQAYDDSQLPSATAAGPALASGFACPVDGLTNQQCYDTYGRATGGELAPTAGTTTIAGVDAILKEDATALAVSSAELLSSGTRFRITFNRKVSDTDIYYCLSGAFHDFAGFTLNTDASDPIGLYYLSGEFTDTVDFITSRHVSDAESLTLDYDDTVGTVGIWPLAELKPLASFSGTSVTNSSALTGGDPSPFTSGAVLHAELDDDDVWSDDGPNGINGIEHGTVTVVDGAATFDGDTTDDITFTDAALDSLVQSSTFTILVQAQLTTNSWNQAVLHKRGAFVGASGGDQDKMTVAIYYAAPGSWYFRVRLADGTTAAASYLDSSPAGNNRKLAMTYDGTTIRCWVDNVEGTSASLSGGAGAGDIAAGGLVIGSLGDLFGAGNTEQMTGSVKKLRIFDYVFSEDEILMHHLFDQTWPYPNLLA